MTIKEFISEAMEIATKCLKAGDHEKYQQCIAIIADAIYEHTMENA